MTEIDWSKSMQQTFEFYKVDPLTWKDLEPLKNIESQTINRDSTNQTLGSSTIDCTDPIDECYVRTYLVAIQNGVTHKRCLGTHLVQTPSVDFNGKRRKSSLDAYTSLIELKETMPPIGYSILKDKDIMTTASNLCRENMRAPIVPAKSTKKLYSDFVSNLDDTWLTFISDLIANAKFQLGLDELGRVIFEPVVDIASLQPVHTYTDDNSSILYPDITDNRDLYGIPNVVEVVYSTESTTLFSRIVNDDPASPISTVNRGREIVHRETNPSFNGEPTKEYLDEYATQLLRNMSTLEHKITYKHGYCDVKVGDCILLNYKRAGFNNVRAKVISQSISCVTGCPVEETAIYTTKLWR
jgi:hypothetical protein